MMEMSEMEFEPWAHDTLHTKLFIYLYLIYVGNSTEKLMTYMYVFLTFQTKTCDSEVHKT